MIPNPPGARTQSAGSVNSLTSPKRLEQLGHFLGFLIARPETFLRPQSVSWQGGEWLLVLFFPNYIKEDIAFVLVMYNIQPH